MVKQLFPFIKKQWKFVKRYGIIKEMVKVRKEIFYFWRKTSRPIKDFLFGKDWWKENAKEDLRIIKKIFKEKGIQFFLIFGTCLGAIREGDFIEYDDDIDLGVTERIPLEIKKEICKELHKEGFYIIQHENYEWCGTIICKRKVETSIHWFQKEGENFVWRDKKGNLELQIPAELLGKFKEVNLGEERFLVPDPPEIYLERTYSDWKTPQKRAHTNRIIN